MDDSSISMCREIPTANSVNLPKKWKMYPHDDVMGIGINDEAEDMEAGTSSDVEGTTEKIEKEKFKHKEKQTETQKSNDIKD
eukprot:15336456-Ditylum_brightwellii.AAC.1